jgi:hypothetical protein
MATRTKATNPKRGFRKLVLSVPITQNAGKPADVRKQNKRNKQLVFPKLMNQNFGTSPALIGRPGKPQMKNTL